MLRCVTDTEEKRETKSLGRQEDGGVWLPPAGWRMYTTGQRGEGDGKLVLIHEVNDGKLFFNLETSCLGRFTF